MNNPLLQPFNTPYSSIPFEEIKLEHFLPAIEDAILQAKQEIQAIKNNSAAPNFKNTIEAYERSGKLLSTISSIFFNLNSANTSDEMQAMAQEISPKLTTYSNEVLMDNDLYVRIKKSYDQLKNEQLTSEQHYLAEKIRKSFVRNGAELSEKEKDKLKEINTQLSTLTLTFGEHVLKDTNAFELLLTDEQQLSGLPPSFIEAAKLSAEQKGHPTGWLITLDYPSYIPFMQYSTQRELRKKLFIAFGSKGFQTNDNNNESSISSIVKLRAQRAKLLGYDSHALYTLEERMATHPKHVYHLWDELIEFALPKAKNELSEIQNYAHKTDGITQFERWDFPYYSEKLKKEKFAINDEVLKPYFPLDKVIQGAFKTAEKLFGITFHPINTVQKYHIDVMTYEVKDKDGSHLALFYADFHPRPSKRGGAWMTSFRDQNKYDGENQRPFVAIVCNFTKPTLSQPSLLTFNEVTTLFHEFGHALHGILADGEYESLSGTSVFWDFVELPSQLMENWCYEKECLDLFAHHYQTGEVIPFDLVQKIKESANFLSAYQTVRQVSLGMLDMAWHTLTEIETQQKLNVSEFENEVTKAISLFEPWNETNTSCSFSHIFSGGYSAGYYSYKWAEVLEADAFELFKQKGIFNREVGEAFRAHILSQGGTAHPMALYKKFRGQEPSSKALLRKCGLID
jgi:Zn-dependent oligopeptidase